MLASDLVVNDTVPQTAGPITWFESFPSVDRVSLDSLANVDKSLPAGIAGPVEPAVGEWIVQLTDSAAKSLRTLGQGNALLNQTYGDFTIISGLGIEGLLLVRGRGATKSVLESSLSHNENVQSFSLNQLIQGQSTTPNDPEFVAGLMPGMERIDATNAWDVSRGSSSTVVGVVDTGIDPTHPDLYLNIWLNQGELPKKYLDDDGPKLVDVDNDGLITFYDLNNATRSATTPYSLTVGGFATGPNASFVSDKNSNGRIDASDLLADANWADGRDTDNNGFFDDFFGVNFRVGSGDPFAANNPSDELGHGTHVAGTIGAIGGNATGVVGVNWQTSLMSLRILDNNNQGDSGAAIRAINYARETRERYRIEPNGRVSQGANVRVLNNSWGQPGGFEVSLETAIQDSSDAGILFVAAAGNGNFLGQGVDNDRTPFYPASYNVPGVIAVAASDASDLPASFSNYGAQFVDLFAPGVGIRSTLSGGGYGSANGTSMATPHVAGTAALIWTAFPEATVDEVQKAILGTVDPVTNGNQFVSTGGRLNASKAINADVFAPAARLIAKQDITTAGGTSTEFKVQYHHRTGIDAMSLGNDDIVVKRQWGAESTIPASLIPGTILASADGQFVTADYRLNAPGTAVFSREASITSSIDDMSFENNIPVAIDSASVNTITSKILVEGLPKVLGNFTVTLDIRHDYISDLKATLIAPNGSRALLFANIGGSNDNFTQTSFNDSARTLISAGSSPYTGTFRPQQSFTSLAFSEANGFWTLEISDNFVDDGGILNNWSLNFPVQTIGDSEIRTELLVKNVSETKGNFKVSVETSDASFRNLSGTLVSPSGNRSVLFSNLASGANNQINATFSDNAETTLTNSASSYSGTFKPLQRIEPLGSNGPNGVWTLELDGNFNADARSKLDWSLSFEGTWDPLDFGDYHISTRFGSVLSTAGDQVIQNRQIGGFHVQIEDPSVKYVSTTFDSIESGSLRDAIITANGAFPAQQTIILDSGKYTIDIPAVADALSSFAIPEPATLCTVSNQSGDWSNESTGDFDILGNILIVGNTNDLTVIDAQGLERVFKVHADATLSLSRLTIQGGIAPETQSGGGILSRGKLNLDQAIVRKNATSSASQNSISGGGVAVWGGNAKINESRVTQNKSGNGGGVFFCGMASGSVERSTFDNNEGGGLLSYSTSEINVENSTFSANVGGRGAVASGFPVISGSIEQASLSADGRYVAFASNSDSLIANGSNDRVNIFVFDRITNEIELVSVSDAGVQGNNNSEDPSMSEDGRFVAFESFANNLVVGDTNGSRDVFVYDRMTKTIERISVNSLGVEGNGISVSPSISADGRYVTFQSFANNLVVGDTNATADVFVYDRVTRNVERVSISDSGAQGNGPSQTEPGSSKFSENNRYVTFQSFASNLVADDTNNDCDVFVFDRVSKTVERVSVNDGGVIGNGGSFRSSLSADGRYVAFDSVSRNFVADDLNGASDIFIYDRTTKKIERVSVSDAGLEGNGFSFFPTLSEDGRYVTFHSGANNLVGSDTNGSRDVFVYDRTSKKIERVSVNNTGKEGNGLSQLPSLSKNARFVAFESGSRNFFPGDNNAGPDIFVYDRFTKVIDPVRKPVLGTVDVSHSTFAFTTIAGAAVSGDVTVNNSLFVANTVPDVISIRNVPGIFNVQLGDDEVRFIGALTQSDNSLPVHQLLLGNKAMRAANPASIGTIDQLGNLRNSADAGAVETLTASVSGTTYVDSNRNGQMDVGEAGLSGVTIVVRSPTTTSPTEISHRIVSGMDKSNTPNADESGQFFLDGLTPKTYLFEVVPLPVWSLIKERMRVVPNSIERSNGDSFRPSLSEDGRYIAFDSEADNLVAGDTNGTFDVFVYDRTTTSIDRISISDAGVGGNARSDSPILSADGRYVTFNSEASNLVVGDTNGKTDTFIYDRTTKTIARVSVSDFGVEGNDDSFSGSLSEDSRYVTFSSNASNLVPGDNNGITDIFVYDRTTLRIQRVSISDGGLEGRGPFGSNSPISSADGRYVTFDSSANNLVANDTNGSRDIFVYDRIAKTIERVSVSETGVEGNNDSYSPSLSADGRYVSFGSDSSNLVSGDLNGVSDSFVYDRTTKKVERVSVSDSGIEANGPSSSPRLSEDGRYATFTSDASNLVAGDISGTRDVFVYDRTTKALIRVSASGSGAEGNGDSFYASLSADGRFVAFSSEASNLVKGDFNRAVDVFVIPNPFLEPTIVTRLRAGEIYSNLNIGLVPDPGTITGMAFDDSVANGVFDPGETAVVNAVVFLDLDSDGLLDDGEPSIRTNADGSYRFLNTDSFRSYSIVIQVPIGFEQIVPSASENFVWNVFLPAGGTVTDRDFAIRRVQSTGQSSVSAVSGRLFDDRNGNKVFDAGDVPIANREVYLDATNFGVRDSNEPRVITDAQGLYAIDGLSSRTVAVTTTLDESLVHVSPLGSNFNLQKFPLFRTFQPFGNPQAIAAGDFNSDGFQDVAVALGEGNKLSIRLNDKLGGFLQDTIDIDLGKDGAGPTALVVGQFDNDTKLDVALSANYASKVTVLLNFNPATKSFASQAAVAVGLLPIDIVSGQFDGDAKLDLIVVNKGAGTVGSTVQVLTNNGNGIFIAGPPIPTGGKDSVSLVAGNFTGDANLDMAVVHASPSTTNTPFGGVNVLRGNGAGGLNLEASYYQVGALPIDSVTADFNGDGRADIAVANFSSNSISILLGQSNGTFRVQPAILGTASGAFDIAIGDIDNDGDTDVIASNLVDRNISIFRNVGVDTLTGDVRFEPLENVGLGQFALAQRMPLVVANFDNDTSGPAGTGTVDIVTIPQRTDTLHVLKNKLVNGTRRVALTGLNRVSGLDFIIKSAILPPSFNEITNPAAIVEDAAEQLISITGIKKGRATGPALRFTATSSNPSLIANPAVSFTDGSVSATLRFTTTPNANGTSVITLRAIDAGANQTFDDDDDGVFERSFTVSVLAVNDAPTMTIPAITTVTQKAGAQSIANFVTGISPGGGSDESGQILSAFTVTTDARFFTVQPSINAAGALLFTPNSNNSGSVIVTVTLSDNGGRASGGVDSTTRNFVITILPMNDPPSFNLGEDLFIEASAGLQTHSGFATGFSPGGGADEASQAIAEYVVTVDTPRIFELLPKIDKLGTLTFTPALDRSGIAIVSVRVRDDGGTLNGGNDLSVAKTFRIVSGAAKTIKLNASELGAHEVAIRNGLLTVTSSGNTIWSLPAADISKLTTVDGAGATLYEVAVPIVNLPGMIRFTGVGKPIELVVDRTAIDLSVLTSDKLFGIEVIDLQAAGQNVLAFRASDINAINGFKTLRILMDRADTLTARGSWRAQAGRLENGAWLQPFTNGGAKIEVISVTPWQNKVNRFDIDGDLAVTPLDVLVLVNLINNNSFPNGQLPGRGSAQQDGFFDPDGDNSVGPLDVLTLINEINRITGAGGEGEEEIQPKWIDQVLAVELAELESDFWPSGFTRRKPGMRRS